MSNPCGHGRPPGWWRPPFGALALGLALSAGGGSLARSAGTEPVRPEQLVSTAVQAGISAPADAYFISPGGQDSNDGRSVDRPFRTFSHAFGVVPGGGTLILLDGIYSEAAGTGILSSLGSGSGQPPSGGPGQPTQVLALHAGHVTVDGTLILGTQGRKDSHIRIAGITFDGGGVLYNTSYVTVKDCGFRGGFGIGTNDHAQGNSHNLIEDVWIWASGERVIAINYRAHENVWRRVVIRGDGCGTADCQGPQNPNVGISVYDSHDVSLQNVIVVDRILSSGDEPYSDFAATQHTEDPQYYLGRVDWLGTLSLRSPDTGYYFEPDDVVAPSYRMRDAVAWDAQYYGFYMRRAGSEILLENLTARSVWNDAIQVSDDLSSVTLRNVLVAGAGRYGISSAFAPSHANVHGAAEGPYNQIPCATGCYAQDPFADGSLRHITRIEPGSFLSGRGAGGADIGANVMLRYGREGTRFGEAGYDELTEIPLWPWPNEVRLKREMCTESGISRGFCSAPSLTRYVWEYLGDATPLPGVAFGSLDTPTDGASGVTGSLPVTGWALDDVAVTQVQVFRDPVGNEPTYPNRGVYVGDATFVAGARPDVAAAYPGYPNADRAGWGYMLLTNLLPGAGNGSFTLSAYATNANGLVTLLGRSEIACSNATATTPFGALDTPGQGETISGDSFLVWGWALTPQPGVIPATGSTIRVFVDGVPRGQPTYNLYRADIASIFPGYANSNGAVGYYVLDTTALANGIHTIAWSVTDSLGRAEGIGSRYFWVEN